MKVTRQMLKITSLSLLSFSFITGCSNSGLLQNLATTDSNSSNTNFQSKALEQNQLSASGDVKATNQLPQGGNVGKMQPPPHLNIKEIETLFPTVAAELKKQKEAEKAGMDAKIAELKITYPDFATYLEKNKPQQPVADSSTTANNQVKPPPPFNEKEIETLFPTVAAELKKQKEAGKASMEAKIDELKKAYPDFATYLEKNKPQQGAGPNGGGKMPPPPPFNEKEIETLFPTVAAELKKQKEAGKASMEAKIDELKKAYPDFATYLEKNKPQQGAGPNGAQGGNGGKMQPPPPKQNGQVQNGAQGSNGGKMQPPPPKQNGQVQNGAQGGNGGKMQPPPPKQNGQVQNGAQGGNGGKMQPPPPHLNIKEIESLFPAVAAELKKQKEAEKAGMDAKMDELKKAYPDFATYLEKNKPQVPSQVVPEATA